MKIVNGALFMPDTYTPTDAMASAAKRGLKMREGQAPSNRGGTSVGLARASQLKNKEGLSLDTVKRMYSFFSRHEVDKQSKSWKEGSSKGEQAWLLWGGDAGYSWSRAIVEREKKASNSDIQSQQSECFKMNRIQCNVLTQVNAGNVMRDEMRGVITLKNVVPIVDDVVMNGGYYQKEDIDVSYESMEDTIAPIGHPTDRNGNFISAKSGSAIQNFYAGAVNKNVTRAGNKIVMDIEIDVNQAMGAKRGRDLMDRIDGMATSLEPIHVSTGLMLNRVEEPGISKSGESYDWVAKNMDYDHVAILLDEPGAATPEKGVGIFANAKGEKQGDVIWCNLDADNSQEIQTKEPEQMTGNTKKFLDALASFVSWGNNEPHAKLMPNSQEEDGEMKNFMIKQLLATNCGKTEAQLNALSDSELEAVVANAMKDSMGDDDSMNQMKKGSMNGYMEDMDKEVNAMKNEMSAMKNMMGDMTKMFDEFKQGRAANREALIANAAKHTGKDASAFDGMTEDQIKMVAPVPSFGLNAAMPQDQGTAAFSLEDTGAQE